MGAAQDAFGSICPISYGEYCSAPWQVTIDVCCGLCPSPAINGYGTIAGLILSSFFAMLIVLYKPDQSAWYIMGQLAVAHMYLVALMARNILGVASNGTNAIQKWHAEFCFLLGASIIGTVLASVLSDTHHIHGFESAERHAEFLQANRALKKMVSQHGSTTMQVHGSHHLHVQPEDRFQPDEHTANARRAAQRTRKWGHRNQALLLLIAFGGSELYWMILYATTIWSGGSAGQKFWQPNCDDKIGAASTAFIQGTSWAFVTIAAFATAALAFTAFSSNQESAAHWIVRHLHLHHVTKEPLRVAKKTRPQRKRPLSGATAHLSRLSVEEQDQSAQLAPETKAEKWLKVGISVGVYFAWFGLTLGIYFEALDKFLLVGWGWPFGALQNLVFGFFAFVRFFLFGVGREQLQPLWARASPSAPRPSPASTFSDRPAHDEEQELEDRHARMRRRDRFSPTRLLRGRRSRKEDDVLATSSASSVDHKMEKARRDWNDWRIPDISGDDYSDYFSDDPIRRSPSPRTVRRLSRRRPEAKEASHASRRPSERSRHARAARPPVAADPGHANFGRLDHRPGETDSSTSSTGRREARKW